MKNGINLPIQIIETGLDGSINAKTYIEILSSNFDEIDKYAGLTNDDLSLIKKTPSVTYIYALKETQGYYSATVSNINELIENGLYIISLNETNDVGTVNLRINGNISKNLNKVNPSDKSLIPLEIGDMPKNYEYFFRYNGSVFVMENINSLTFSDKKIEDFVLKNEVIDALDSSSIDTPLSANQGNFLNNIKSEKDLSNVDNDIFKKKALDSGVITQLFLKDLSTHSTYNVQIQNAKIVLMEVDVVGEKSFNLIDIISGKNYKLIIENRILKIEEI